MAAEPRVQFYLGANAPSGFYSLYDQLIDPDQAQDVMILKGGPGCGKSSLMRKVGAAMEERGLTVEYIQCSGDPDSLDAVVIPALATAIVDGTAPHGCATQGRRAPPCKKTAYPGLGQAVSGCRKSPRTFSTACRNAVTFPPHSGGKVLAPLAGSLAAQGFRGIRFHARRAAAPSRSPAPVQAGPFKLRFFDTQRRRIPNRDAPSLYGCDGFYAVSSR
ncbi:hypothetical protein [uncultured Pseudoflavonifractor sp.]|uniref:hypothetical protein n=1 Tax=uncultured Pseudoflavonifractor sp. TaxID=1221379 RepID=UPI0025EA7450|nr:hypothetical protein [uncultured Pseudoflavonifractor sp.]